MYESELKACDSGERGIKSASCMQHVSFTRNCKARCLFPLSTRTSRVRNHLVGKLKAQEQKMILLDFTLGIRSLMLFFKIPLDTDVDS